LDGLEWEVGHSGPRLDWAQARQGRGLLAWPVRQGVNERLHQGGPQDVHGYRTERVWPFGKSEFAAPCLSRCWRVALKFWARHERADNSSETLVSDLRCVKGPASCHF